MMKLKLMFLLSLCLLMFFSLPAQEVDSPPYKYFIGSTLFMLFNFTADPPDYYQLNFGYRITPKDVLSFEAITWTYGGPLGRQYGPDYENPASDFPGRVRAVGGGLAYKRFLWKRVYTQIHATALHQTYQDEVNEKIQNGFQLFCAARMGYQFRFFNNRVFLEPSLALTFWPINTNLPADFQAQEDRFSGYFLGEPGLHFGFNF